MTTAYLDTEPSRTDVATMTGPTLIEFGAPWCGVCRASQPAIAAALAAHPGVRHVKVADGPGKPLGRSFGVKLWPTLILLRDGAESGRVVRPSGEQAILEALARLGT